MKRVLAVHDISCVGKCSSTVALPVISAAGIECSLLPTALLSTHTGGFTNYTFLDLTEEMEKIFNHFKSLNLKVDAIYSGYIGNSNQIASLIEKVNYFKRDGCLIVCDPVMADNGKLYSGFNEEFVKEMKELVCNSDIVIPNLTEASFILNREYKTTYTENDIKEILENLTRLGPKLSILSGVSFEEGKLGAMAFDSTSNKFYKYFSNKVDGYFHGTGDLFSSAIVGCLINNIDLEKTLEISVNFVYNSILETHKKNLDPKYGVEFEYYLSNYSSDILKNAAEPQYFSKN